MPRPDSIQQKMKHHFVREWDGITACGRDSLFEDLNQTRDEDLVECQKCKKALSRKDKP